MNIAQSFILNGDRVIAMEDIYGTNEMINKIGKINFKFNNLIFVKSKKLNQIDEIDFPIIGMKTLKLLIKYKFRAICLFNNNILISEKYVQAGIYLASGNDKDAKILLDEIILSRNNFYSILALNVILDKNLEIKKDLIMNYFKVVEKMNISKEQRDLVILKKGLYLLKYSNSDEGEKLLKSLIDSNSALKSLVEEIVSK